MTGKLATHPRPVDRRLTGVMQHVQEDRRLLQLVHPATVEDVQSRTGEIGNGTFFSPSGRLFARNRISIGEWCAIGWETQILDDNQHPMTVDDQEHAPEGTVTIGRHVWVGSRVSILKDTVIGDGCVIAAGAVVKGDFSEPGCLIGGTPARVIRRGVSWQLDRNQEKQPHVTAR